MDILVAAALKREVSALRKRIGAERSLLVTGLGTDRTANRLEAYFERSRPDCLLFTGTAGQLDPDRELGEVVAPAGWQTESGTGFKADARLLGCCHSAGAQGAALGLTVHVPVVTGPARQKRFEETGAAICDMESTAVLMVTQAYEVPCVSLKVISDSADSGLLAFYRGFDRNMDLAADCVARMLALLES